MEVTIQSIHFDADAKLLEFIEKKVEKLAAVNNKIISGEVYLKVDNAEARENKLTEIKLHVPGNTIFSKEKCKTFEEGTDLAVQSLRRQLRKLREKELNH